MAPSIFLAFSNQQNNYLHLLKEEDRGLWDILITHKLNGSLDFINRGYTSAEDIYDSLTKVQQSLEVFHYAGHANSFHLELDNETHYNLDKLVALLALCPELKLIFLNGCSTWGIVEKIKSHEGIKAAVIATHVDIPDRGACDFAINFYKALIGGGLGGASLEAAFEAAKAHLKAGIEAKLYDRDLFRSIGERSKTKPAPWGLYGFDSDILNWRFQGQQPSNDIDIDLAEINAKIKAEYEQLKPFRDEFNLLQELKSFDRFDEFKGKLVQQQRYHELAPLDQLKASYAEGGIAVAMEAVEKKMDEARSKVTKLLNDKSGLISDHLKNRHEDKLKRAFFDINYNFQKPKIFKQLQESELFNAFIIRGDVESAHNLLIRSIIQEKFVENETKQVRLNFNPEVKVGKPPETKEEIWQKVIVELYQSSEGLSQPDLNAPSPTVIEHLLRDFSSIILIFDNLPEIFLQASLALISTFYEDFLQFQQANEGAAGEYQGRIVLFINVVQWPGLQTEGWYEQAAAISPPVITPLQASDLLNWQNHAGLYLEFEEYQELLGPQGQEVLAAIRSVCNHINRKDIYQQTFSKFESHVKIDRL